LGGFIASANYHLLFWIDGLTNIGAAVLLAAVLSPARSEHTPSKKDTPVVENTRSAYADKKYLVFIVLTILFGICFFQIFSTLPVFFKEQLHLTPFFIGVIMSVNGILIALFEMALVFLLEKKQRNLQYIIMGVLLMGLSFVVFNVVPGTHSLALLSTLIITAGEMLSMPFMNSFWISRTDEGNRGQYAGLYTAAWSIAQVIGPLGGAQVVHHFSFTALWWVIGAVSVVTAAGFRWLQLRSTKA
jgi:predicted MFS family arabinose efflux permease